MWKSIENDSLKTAAGTRTVNLHPQAQELLTSFVGPRTDGFIFKSRSGKHLHERIARQHWPAFHQLRRYRISHCRKARVSEDWLKLQVGHSLKASITDSYFRADESWSREQCLAAGIGFTIPERLIIRELQEVAV